jgi:hypothetical protein
MPLYELDIAACKRIGVPYPFTVRVVTFPDDPTMARAAYNADSRERVASILSLKDARRVED